MIAYLSHCGQTMATLLYLHFKMIASTTYLNHFLFSTFSIQAFGSNVLTERMYPWCSLDLKLHFVSIRIILTVPLQSYHECAPMYSKACHDLTRSQKGNLYTSQLQLLLLQWKLHFYHKNLEFRVKGIRSTSQHNIRSSMKAYCT